MKLEFMKLCILRKSEKMSKSKNVLILTSATYIDLIL